MAFGTPGAIQAPPASAGVLGQGVKYPPTLTANGRLALSWGQQSVQESIVSIARTQRHERVMLPGYGADASTFEPIELHRYQQQLESSIADYEPRAVRVSVDVRPNPTQLGSAIAFIQFATANDASLRTLTVPLFIGPAATPPSQ